VRRSAVRALKYTTQQQATPASCLACHERIEVICIYCESGADSETGEPMTRFTMSNIRAMDAALATQLKR